MGTNYVLLGLIVEQVTGRSVADVLRSGVLSGDGYERLIYQPDERPTEPMAMPLGASADTFDEVGGSLPSLARVTAESAEANMASDSSSLARWWRALCAGEIVSAASLNEMTDVYPRVLDELLPTAFHRTEVHANNRLEADHGRLKARLRPMRGLKRDRTAGVIVAGHAFVQSLRRGHYDLGTDAAPACRVADAFAELARAI